MKRTFFNLILLFVLINILLKPLSISAQEAPLSIPQSLEESKELGEKSLKTIPQLLQNGWQEGFGILKNWWDNYISVWLGIFWSKVKNPFLKEVERRKSSIEEESETKIFQSFSEKKSTWERLKELLK
mgnify:CR=1 FL=1